MKRHFLCRPMTLREAAAELGMGDDYDASRRLAYLIRQREAETGKRIIVGGGRGRKCLITVASLRRHFPELVDDQSYFAKMLDEALDEIREDLLELRQRDNALAAQIRELKKIAKACEQS